MSIHEFTDEQIIKALEVCVANDSCKECPINPNHGNYGYCTNLALTHALDLINRQRAEIEKFSDIGKLYSEIKAEAIKEFAEKLTSKLNCIPQHHFTLAQVLFEISAVMDKMKKGNQKNDIHQ